MSLALDLSEELQSFKGKNLYRQLETIGSPRASRFHIGKREFVNFTSNNYLGLAQHPFVLKKATQTLREWGAGSGASRLLSGNFKIHEELERKLARFKREQAAIVFSSGYLANLGAVTALLNEQDVVLVDRLNHASLIDAARLSKAKLWVYPHKDVFELKKLLQKASRFRRRLVLTDAYFSMDGDTAPLDKLLELCRATDSLLMVDEAHSTGVFGRTGGGLTECFCLQGQIDVVMGTLSKALGSVGGYICGRSVLREYLVNRCREFIYTTAPSPVASGAALASLEVIQNQPEIRKKLWANVHFLRNGLESLGFDLMGSEGPIIPIKTGEPRKTLKVKEALMKEGIFSAAIRPPTVSKGTDRIRLSVTADHQKRDLEKVLITLKKIKDKVL